jgi:SAM-dependent methyltransferase
MCGALKLVPLPEFETIPRITSDCRTFPAGGRLAVCGACGGVQKYPDDQWLAEIEEIYDAYAAYYQADGDEQIILDSRSGTVRRRSDVIVERLIDSRQLPSSGKALDIGCGSGVTLSALSRVLPGWSFCGQDLDERNETRLTTISGFKNLFVCKPSDIPDQYDLITLIHSLEHFSSPGDLLQSLRAKLAPGGILLVQVCDTVRNPYDLLIADHLSHFSSDTLRLLADNSGFEVQAVETGWVNKELSMIAVDREISSRPSTFAASEDAEYVLDRVRTQLHWLAAMAEDAGRQGTAGGDLGIFGTSICATWLAGILGERVGFFVDEDPSRQGKEFMGKPVLAPNKVNPQSRVYMALVPEIALHIGERLKALPLQLIQPPTLNVR